MTLYINVKTPREDAFFEGKFKSQVKPFGGPYFYSAKSKISIPINKIPEKIKNFGLMIQDLYPKVKNYKCHHRIYFEIFEEYQARDLKNNAFSIALKNFNQCFVESYILDNEIFFIDNNKNIYWDDKEFVFDSRSPDGASMSTQE